ATSDGFQCFPLYTYSEASDTRRENISNWVLGQFQAKYGLDITSQRVFHYVYSLLHHPLYRARYVENLKRELPRIPLLPSRTDVDTCVRIGKALMRLHLDYEEVKEWPLEWVEASLFPLDWRVTKMKLSRDKTHLVYNDTLTLAGIPSECLEYRLGN